MSIDCSSRPWTEADYECLHNYMLDSVDENHSMTIGDVAKKLGRSKLAVKNKIKMIKNSKSTRFTGKPQLYVWHKLHSGAPAVQAGKKTPYSFFFNKQPPTLATEKGFAFTVAYSIEQAKMQILNEIRESGIWPTGDEQNFITQLADDNLNIFDLDKFSMVVPFN